MKTNFRTKVFRRAHEIMRATGKAFSVCLSKAWAVYRLIKRMRKGATSFTFEKKDGSLRRATGILKDIPGTGSGSREENFKTVAYFDIDRNAFRCFKVENLISIL